MGRGEDGHRWTAYIAGAISAIVLVYILIVFVLEVTIRPAWVVPSKALTVLGFFLGYVLFGGIIGAVVGLIVGLTRLVLPGRPHSNSSSVTVPSATASPRSTRRRWPLLVGLTLLVVIVAAAGTGLYLQRKVNDRLNAASAAADREDPFWRIDDLMAHRAVVPDEQNSAAGGGRGRGASPRGLAHGAKAAGRIPPSAKAGRGGCHRSFESEGQ